MLVRRPKRFLLRLLIAAAILVLGQPVNRAVNNWRALGRFDLTSPDLAVSPPDVPLTVSGGGVRGEREVERAIGQLRLPPVGRLVVRIEREPAGCEPCLAAYRVGSDEIVVDDQLLGHPAVLRGALAHEIGHLVDDRVLGDDGRQRYARMRGAEGPAWSSARTPWAERPSEDFAEAFAVVVQPCPYGPVGTAYGTVDESAFESLLAEEGVPLPPRRRPSSARDVARREMLYASDAAGMYRDQLMLLVGLGLEAVGLAPSATRTAFP